VGWLGGDAVRWPGGKVSRKSRRDIKMYGSPKMLGSVNKSRNSR